jgi:tRNA-dihydrouridine synthase A
LRHDWAYRLKRDFPQLTIVINGGITSNSQIAEHLQHMDGAMLGREAYHNPWWLSSWDAAFYDVGPREVPRDQIEQQMCDYMSREFTEFGTPWSAIARHMLGLRHGLPGARKWRQVWSDHRLKTHTPHQVMALAHSPNVLVA